MSLLIADDMFIIHMQTPDGALLDSLRNAYDLLSQCDIKIPKVCPLISPVTLMLDFFP